MEDEAPTRSNVRTAVVLFVATLATTYTAYGLEWSTGNPFTDPDTALESARFAITLMAILLAHEMGHYVVARHHGFRLSLPYFIPFPFAFGTFGAIIRLKSLPRTRTALLEMGAAGPLAGFGVALIAIALGMPSTQDHGLTMTIAWPPPLPAPPSSSLLHTLAQVPPLSWLMPPADPGLLVQAVLANPLAMDLIGDAILGAPPGRYAYLDPVALAGWVGCLLTAINLVPIGQLDGGHVFNALAPRFAPKVSGVVLMMALVAGLLWPGWAVWAILIYLMRAWVSLPVPWNSPVTNRARLAALCCVVAFVLSFMPRPFQIDTVPLQRIDIRTPDGRKVTQAEVSAWVSRARASLAAKSVPSDTGD